MVKLRWPISANRVFILQWDHGFVTRDPDFISWYCRDPELENRDSDLKSRLPELQGWDPWPVTVGVWTRYGVSQPGADAGRYRCALTLNTGWLGVVTGVSVAWTRGVLV